MKRFRDHARYDLPDFAGSEYDYSDDYEYLFDMEKKELVCRLGEPEDRTFARDLAPLVSMINDMDAEIKKLKGEK